MSDNARHSWHYRETGGEVLIFDEAFLALIKCLPANLTKTLTGCSTFQLSYQSWKSSHIIYTNIYSCVYTIIPVFWWERLLYSLMYTKYCFSQQCSYHPDYLNNLQILYSYFVECDRIKRRVVSLINNYYTLYLLVLWITSFYFDITELLFRSHKRSEMSLGDEQVQKSLQLNQDCFDTQTTEVKFTKSNHWH